jgi:hypothetical protein
MMPIDISLVLFDFPDTINRFCLYAAVEIRDRIRTTALVRNSTHIFNSLSMGRKLVKEEDVEEQKEKWIHQETKVREVLTKLRRREVNLLVATCK